MAYTLAQLAKIETEPLRKGVIMNLLRDSKLMEVIPWTPVSSLTSIAVRYKTLPTGGAFRKIGGSYTETTDGDVEQIWESVYPFGGEIKFDRIFDNVKNVIVDPKVQQTQMKLKSMALDFNNYFINGDNATDPDGFEGLKKRVAGMPSRMSLVGCTTTTSATPVSSAASARYFLDAWEKAWYRAGGTEVKGIFLNEGMYLGFPAVLRYLAYSGGNVLDVTKDSYEREIVTYKGAPLIDVGLKKDQSTEIITHTEADSGGAGTECTSVYFAAFNEEQGVTGIQLGPMEVLPLAETVNGPYTMTRIEWVVGLASLGSYGISRLYQILSPDNW